MQVRNKGNLNFSSRIDSLLLLGTLILALGFRLPGLTVFLTADEARSWFGRSIIFLDSLLRADWANTGPGGTVPFIENVSLSPAPGVTTMWSGAAGIVLDYLRQGRPGALAEFVVNIPFDPLDPAMLVSLRLPGVLIVVAAAGLTFWWSRPLLGRWGAFLAATFVALDPFYLALSRVLGHDAPVATFMWLSLLAFLRGSRSESASQRVSESAGERGSEKAEEGEGEGAKQRIGEAATERSGESEERRSRRVGKAETSSEKAVPLFGAGLLPSDGWILLSGALAGLAFLSKYPALFMGAFVGLMMLILYLSRFWLMPARNHRLQSRSSGTSGRGGSGLQAGLTRWLRDMILWTVAAGIVFILFWPAMWVDPREPVTTILNDALRASGGSHPKGSFFLGRPVPDPGLLFYPVVLLLRTTPVVFLGFLLALWILVRTGLRKSKAVLSHRSGPGDPTGGSRSVLLMLLAYILFYTLLVTYGGKKQDRYLLPIFPAVMMLAATGYLYLLRYRFQSLRVRRLILAGVIILQGLLIFPYHPYYFSYYNPFAGGGPTAAHLVQVGWGEGLDQAAAYLNTLPDVESTEVTAWYSTTFEPYFQGQAIYKLEEEKISRSAKPGLAADYVVFYVNQVQRQLPSEGVLQFFQRSSPVYTVTLQGIDYAWIYPSIGLNNVFAGEVRLVGQAELLGFDLTNEAGQPIETVYPESVAYFSLYWEWQGKAADEPIQISLIDDQGNTRGWGNPIETVTPGPYDQWPEGMVVRSDFALVIFPDTPPGRYRLSVWIDRPATGETVGVFPDTDDVTIRVVPRETEE